MVHNVSRMGKLNIVVEQHQLCCLTDQNFRPSFATRDLEENQTSFFFSPLSGKIIKVLPLNYDYSL